MFSQDFMHGAMTRAMARGGDYCDIFIEDKDVSVVRFDDGKVRGISTRKTAGVGIRVIFGTRYVYLYTSDPDEKTILDLAEEAAGAVSRNTTGTITPFRSASPRHLILPKINPGDVKLQTKVEYVERANQAARDHSSLIKEVSVSYMDEDQRVTIANSDGNFVNDRRVRTRFMVHSIAERGSLKESGRFGPGRGMGFEFFEVFTPEQIAQEAVREALVRLDADFAPKGKMPVVIDKEFGGVIFHEACGHALEATAVADDASVFCGKMGQPIASAVVNAIDDGTIPGAWGSADFDDEGNPTQRNQLIKDGILTSYMIDKLGSIKMGVPGTRSSRRQNYKFAPTSRMTNTFIEKGNDSFEDMIASIDEGIYCRRMGGGSVNPPTTDFNFAVEEGYLIKNGKIDRPVKGASLIGKGSEILMNIEMVGKEIDINGTGMCGSRSGSIPTCVGQPPIKVGGLVVGGR